MQDFKFQVDLKGIIKLLSDSLYSNEDVFLRELLQNAIDAINARKQKDSTFIEEILVYYEDNFENNKAILTFKDNGIGLTKNEIHEFLSIIGKSSKSSEDSRSSFIGQFGIGLLSCFLVSDTIKVHTKSSLEKIGYTWYGKSDGTYEIIDNPLKVDQGTEIIFEIKGQIYSKYTEDTILEILNEYAYMVKTPVYLLSSETKTQINSNFIPWLEPFFTMGSVMEFGESLLNNKFFDAIPISGKGINGYAFITQNPHSSKIESKHKMYLKDMLITEKSDQLLPKWAFFLQCVINFEDLTPTASRESFYNNNKLLHAKAQIENCILEYFTNLAKYNRHKLKILLGIHNVSIKSLLVDNDKVFITLFPFIIFHTNKGQMTGTDILKLSQKDTVYYCSDIDSYRKMRPIMDSNNKILINGGYIYDSTLLNKVKKFYPSTSITAVENDTISSILNDVDDYNDSFASLIEEVNEVLRLFNVIAELKRFSPNELSYMFVPSEVSTIANGLAEENNNMDMFFVDEDCCLEYNMSKLYFNYNNTLIKKLLDITDSDIRKILVEVLYLQSLMIGHYPIGNKEMKLLSSNLTKLIELGITNMYD